MTDGLSASHIELKKMCVRREVFAYRQGLREPGSLATEAGQQVHAVLENYLRDGTPIDTTLEGALYPIRKDWSGTPLEKRTYKIGALAQLMTANIPSPGTVTQVETEFVAELHGITFKGVYDWATDTELGDHKTTSNLLYMKTEEDLENDTQRLIYSELLQHVVSCVWNYGGWERYDYKAKAYVPLQTAQTRFVIDREKDRERFKLHVLSHAEEILSMPQDVDPLSIPLPANYKDKKNGPCGKFPPTGCPYKSKCFPPTLDQGMSGRMSKLLDKLRAQQGPEPVATPSVVAAAEPSAEAQALVETIFDHATNAPVTNGPDPQEPRQTHLIDTLFVDCYPLSTLDTPVVHAYELIAKASATVAADAQLPHARLIDFSKGDIWIAVEFVALLQTTPVKYLYLETKSAEGRACMQAAVQNARLVIKGGL